MSPQHELVEQWRGRAEDDLHMADLALGTEPPVVWAAAFHAQQAVEKTLKAFLTAHAIEFEKVHSIDYLLDLCVGADAQFEALRVAASRLTDFAVEARYPFPHHDPTEAEARDALATARQVRQFVAGRLPEE
jgi:HEPN domain-containing protein